MALGSLPTANDGRGAPTVPGDIIKAREIFDTDALPVFARRSLCFPEESRRCSSRVVFEVERRVTIARRRDCWCGDGECDVAL